MKTLTLAIFSFLTYSVLSQNPYTESKYSIQSEMDVVYGTSTDYAGNEVELTMDIFKPISDENCKRPVVIFLHGGAWAVGSKEDESIQSMAQEMAKKGWVTAAINYRLGTHNTPDYEMSMFCSADLSEPCAYISDTAEAIRANYRAMQDAKGAVRFLKNRNTIDSTDINNFFMAGESAGAFTSFLVGFLDHESKKPDACLAIEDAPAQSSYFTNNPCSSGNIDLSRPDLGSVEGSLNIGEYDSSIKGIGSFFGAVFDISIFENVNTSKSIYLFAQGADVIVHYEYDKLFGRIDNECYNNFLCQNYANYPYCTGNEGLRQHFEANPNLPISYQADIIDNYNAGGNCLDTGHEIDSPELRLQNMTDFFANDVVSSGNNPQANCNLSVNNNDYLNSIYITQNTDFTTLKLHHQSFSNDPTSFVIVTQLGQIINEAQIDSEVTTIDTSKLTKGIYFIKTYNGNQTKTHKFIIN